MHNTSVVLAVVGVSSKTIIQEDDGGGGGGEKKTGILHDVIRSSTDRVAANKK